ncbi:MAG: ion transporter, partial [Pseudomonadota bacterium]
MKKIDAQHNEGNAAPGVGAAPYPTSGLSRLRARAVRLTEDARFRNTILGVIIFNAVILGLETSDSVIAVAGGLLDWLDRLCLAIFVVEIALKLVAQSWRFFIRGWNVFDFLIVGISLAPAGEGLSVLRALRILRVLRLITAAPRLRR